MKAKSRGSIQLEDDFELKQTLESGQTFLWNRKDKDYFDDTKDNTYYTLYNDDSGNKIYIEVYQDNATLYWKSNKSEAQDKLKKRLGLNYNISKIKSYIKSRDTKDGIMDSAIDFSPGYRVVNDPFYPTLISFICSTQMRVERIHQMINNIKREYGEKYTIKNKKVYAFPQSKCLASASVQELKDLKLGYRARYVKESAMLYDKQGCEVYNVSRDIARRNLKSFTGVGIKVADCVLLYGSERTDVVPVDTWIKRAVERHYPSISADSRKETARNFENKFGKYSGFAQGYIFNYMRKADRKK